MKFLMNSIACFAECGDNCESCSVAGTCDSDTCDTGYGYVQDGDNNYGDCNGKSQQKIH